MIIIGKKTTTKKKTKTKIKIKIKNNYSDIKVNICLGGVEFAKPVCRHYR